MAAAIHTANAQMVKMCLFYKPSGHARTDPILSDTCVSDHVHTFYGPQLFHPTTTPADLRASDPRYSTSPWVENKSLYWHPTIYKVGQDAATGQPTYELAEISFSGPYYRWDKSAPAPAVEAFPPGFQMIAGMDPNLEGVELFSECLCERPCTRSDGLCDSDSDFFPSSACGEMGISMNFPTCWDDSKGIGDTGDHMSHMAYTVDGTVEGACPKGYNRRLPQIQLFVRIADYEGGKYTFSDNTLASDTEVFHADFMNGWVDGSLEKIVKKCKAIPGTGGPGDYNPPCNCDQFLTKKSDLLNFETEEGRNDAEAANVCPIDITTHIVDEVIDYGVGGLPRGSCSADIIENVAPTFVDNCGLKFTPNTFDEGNCEGGSGDGDDDDDDDDDSCEDDEEFLFKDQAGKTCEWIGERQSRVDRYCKKLSNDKKVFKSCPEACGKCEDTCEDDAEFLFKGRAGKTCEWIGEKPSRVDRYCKKLSNGKKVFKSCPEACEKC